MKAFNIASLNKGIEQAQAEINKYTAGGPITAAWTKMKKLVGIDNPIVKVTTFADALERGFAQIPRILKNNGIDTSKKTLADQGLNPENATLRDVIVKQLMNKNANEAQGDRPPPPTISSKDIEDTHKANTDPKGQAKIKAIIAQLTKALSPGGIFGIFKKVPYVDSAALANDLINAPLQDFVQVVQTAGSGAKAAEVATDMKGAITGQGGAETKGTGKEAPTVPGSQTQPSAPGKPTTATADTAPTGQVPAPADKRGGGEPAKGRHAPAISKISKESGVDEETATKLIRHMAKLGLVDLDKLAQHGTQAK